MIILALESTAKVASVAICRDGEILYSAQGNNGMTHSQQLLPMVQYALEHCQISPNQIDRYAVTMGPGSFTGVRIAIAVVKGLAFGKGECCAGVSTLLSLARNIVPLQGIYCPVMDARREQVYTALFRYENGILTRLTEDAALSLTDLADQLKAYQDTPIYLCGDGYDVAGPRLKEAGIKLTDIPASLRPQNAASTALCVLDQGDDVELITADALEPLYLRLPQAERERLKAQE